MKNLSKVLSLVLALAMIVGVFTIGAAAFTDDEDISYEEPVAVLSAIGVLNGFEDGSFKPEGTITREQAAKIITYLTLGESVAEGLTCDVAPFNDVAATRWSAKYIRYCASQGIIAGRGDGNFDPTANVTGNEFAKMLLVALGFDAEENGLVGLNWDLNTFKLALAEGLFAGNLGAAYNEAATREEAALYAFNALFHSETGAVTERIYGIVGWETKTVGEDETLVPVYGWIDVVNAGVDSLANTVFNLTKSTTALNDEFGRPATTYLQKGKVLVQITAEPVLTYTTPVLGKQLYAALGLTAVPHCVEYLDGIYYYDDYDITASSTDEFGGNGVLTEVYKTADNEYTVVQIWTYIGTVKSVKTTTDPSTGKKTTTLTLTGTWDGEELTTTEFTNFAKGDVVLFTYSEITKKIESLEKAPTISGTVTKAVNGTNFTIGGTVYQLGDWAEIDADDIVALMGKTETFYVDKYGYLMDTVAAVVAETAGTYINVLAADKPTTSADYINANGDYTGKVYGILSDGTYGEYTVNYGEESSAVAKGIYAYELNTAGQMVLGDKVIPTTTTAEVKSGATTADGVILNSNTVFVFFTQEAKSAAIKDISVKTGNANCGVIAAGAQIVAEKGIALVVYVGGTYDDGTVVADVAFVDDTTEQETKTAEVVNGSVVTKTVFAYTATTAEGEEITLTSAEALDSGVYFYNEDNTVAATVTVADGLVGGELTVYGSTLKVGDAYYNYNADMVAFLGEDAALANTQRVIGIVKNGTLTHLWVVTDAAPVEA